MDLSLSTHLQWAPSVGVILQTQFVPICCCNISGQTQFVLNCCCNISGQIQFVLKCCCNISGQTENSVKQTGFFAGFTNFFVQFFALRQSLCTWHGYFEKTSVRACFFWLQRPLIQSSGAPQGSPPPTQQIKIQMQISWVGWSTNRQPATCNLLSKAYL